LIGLLVPLREAPLFGVEAQTQLLNSFLNRDIGDILIQYGQTGMGKTELCQRLPQNQYNVEWFDAVMGGDFERACSDLNNFRDERTLVMVIEGAEYFENDSALFGAIMSTEIKFILNCNNLADIDWKIRRSAIQSYFPPATPEAIEAFVKSLKPEADMKVFVGVRDYRAARSVLEGGLEEPQERDATPDFKSDTEYYWYLCRHSEDRQLLAEADLTLGSPYLPAILGVVRCETLRPWNPRDAMAWSIATKLQQIILDSKRKIVQHHLFILIKMQNPSMNRMLKALELTKDELNMLHFKDIKVDKKQFRPQKKEPEAESIDNYF